MTWELPYPDNTFACIELDYPWDYADKGYNGFQTVQKYRIHCPYQTMGIPALIALGSEINRVAQDNCHLWKWTTKDFLDVALQMLTVKTGKNTFRHGDWHFFYKQIFTWVKTGYARSMIKLLRKELGDTAGEKAARIIFGWGVTGKPKYGMGHWGRNAQEFLLFATKGKLPMLGAKTTTSNVFFAPTGRHSEKPEAAYKLIESLSPGPRLSLFSRKKRHGWECWGNEVE